MCGGEGGPAGAVLWTAASSWLWWTLMMRLNREPKLIKRTVWNIFKVFWDERHQWVTKGCWMFLKAHLQDLQQRRGWCFSLFQQIKRHKLESLSRTQFAFLVWLLSKSSGSGKLHSLKLGFRPNLLDLCPILWHQEAHFAAAVETRGSPIQMSICLILAVPDWMAFGENRRWKMGPADQSCNSTSCLTWVYSPSIEQFKRPIILCNMTQVLAKPDHLVFSSLCCVLSHLCYEFFSLLTQTRSSVLENTLLPLFEQF